jgi:hypothetical protein
MSTALRSLGLLDVLSSTPAGPSIARLVSMPVCAASLQNPLEMRVGECASDWLSIRFSYSTMRSRSNDLTLYVAAKEFLLLTPSGFLIPPLFSGILRTQPSPGSVALVRFLSQDPDR